MNGEPIMVKRAERRPEEIGTEPRPRSAPRPPANDNRQPGLFAAIAIVVACIAVIGAVAWWILV